MAHIDQFFPSKYLKASDLDGRDVKVFIDRVVGEEFDRDDKTESKPVVYFIAKEKGVVLNKTNATVIASSYGGDFTKWHGCQVTLYTAMVDAFGETREAIRVRVTAENMRAQPEGVTVPAEAVLPDNSGDGGASTDDDSLPF